MINTVAIVSPAGKQPPTFERNPLSEEKHQGFIKEYDQIIWRERGEMPRNQVRVLELLGWSRRQVIKDTVSIIPDLSLTICHA